MTELSMKKGRQEIGNPEWRAAHVPLSRVELNTNCLHILDFGVALVQWIHEVLNLTQSELEDPQETSARGDLVTESLAHTRAGEGQSTAICLQQAREIHENALCSLRAHEAAREGQ